MAIYLMLESKKDASSPQIARTIDVIDWHLYDLFRKALGEEEDDPPKLLQGIIKVDETGVGGKQ